MFKSWLYGVGWANTGRLNWQTNYGGDGSAGGVAGDGGGGGDFGDHGGDRWCQVVKY